MRTLFYLFAFLSIFLKNNLYAQQQELYLGTAGYGHKINVDLLQRWLNTESNQRDKVYVSAIVEGDLATVQRLMYEYKGVYKFGINGLSSLRFRLDVLPVLLATDAIKRIETQSVKPASLYLPDDSLTLIHNNITAAHEGAGILPKGYEGQNVLIGVIDDGFDWRHPDFQTADSNTRVAYFWDQSISQNGYLETQLGYGSSWAAADINAGHCRQTTMTHGTHVAGIASGNGNAARKFKGVAPLSNMLWVKIEENNADFVSNFVDAVYWIAQKSQHLGKPCAINSSVGTYFGSHDGKDLASRLIDNILSNQNGLALIQAAGNARQYNFHLSKAANSWVSNTYFKYLAATNSYLFVLYADTNELNSLDFNFSIVDNQLHYPKAQTRNYNIQTDFNFGNAWADTLQEVFYDAQNQAIRLNIYVSLYAGTYEVLFELQTNSSLDYCQFQTLGVGSFDVWSSELQIGSSDMVFYAQNPPLYYQNADNYQSIVSSWACSDKVITVGSYQNQTFMLNYNRDSVYLGTAGYPQGGISPFSSLGPTRDGRIKPDLCASGGQVLSAAPIINLVNYRANNYSNLDSAGWHVSNRGTSMSAPLVAGALGLLLECNPNANYQDCKNALYNSARLDSFVFKESGQLPNLHWGYGKLDVYKLLLACMRGGCTDTNAVNFDPTANYDNGTCLFLPLSLHENLETCIFYPNPISNDKILYYQIPTQHIGKTLFIYNCLSQLVFSTKLEAVANGINLSFLNSGAYFIKFEHYNNKIILIN
jgi:subtilisin family serine protease